MKASPKVPDHRILIFNSSKRLVAIAHSVWAASRLFDVKTERIKGACTGKQISTKNFYFRFLYDDIEVTFQDFGTLNLCEYDQLCGIERSYYATNKMSRKGMKYKPRKKKVEDENQDH